MTELENLQRVLREFVTTVKPLVERAEAILEERSVQLSPEELGTAQILQAVADSSSLKAAAGVLNMEVRDLEQTLKEKVEHLYGERWSVAAARHLRGERAVDTFDYSALEGKLETIIRALEEGRGLAEIAKKLQVPSKVVGRFLSNHGYNTKGKKQ